MIKDLLSEDGVHLSTMRVMSLISLLVGSFIGIAGLYLGKDLVGLAALCSVFISAAFVGKVVQRNIEGKS